jgi:O-antigen/teichoic acid export membrane protein
MREATLGDDPPEPAAPIHPGVQGSRPLSFTQELKHAGPLAIGSGLATNALLLLGSVVAARELGAADFGALSMLNSTAGLAGFFAGTGLATGASRLIAQADASSDAHTQRQLGALALASVLFGGAAGAILFLARRPVSVALGIPAAADLLMLTALLVVANSLQAFVQGCCLGVRAYRTAAALPVLSAALTSALLVALAPSLRLLGALAAYPAAIATSLIPALFILRGLLRGRLTPLRPASVADCRVLWAFTLPAALQSLILVPVAWACRWVLASTANGLAETAIFAVALSWMTLILFVPNRLAPYLTAFLSRQAASSPLLGPIAGSAWASALASFLSAVLVGIPVIAAAPIIMCTYGDQFCRGGGTLRAMAVAAVLGAQRSDSGRLCWPPETRGCRW